MSFGMQGGGGVGGFLENLLQGLHQSNVQRMEMSAAQRSIAQQQWDANAKIMAVNPALANDPNQIKKMQNLAKTLGLPDPGQNKEFNPNPQAPTDGAQGTGKTSMNGNTAQVGTSGFKPTDFGTPPLKREQQANMGIINPDANYNDLDRLTKDEISQAQPGHMENGVYVPGPRDTKLAGIGNVPDIVRNGPASLSSMDKKTLMTNIHQTISSMGKGQISKETGIAEIAPLIQQAKAMGIDLQTTIDTLTQDAVTGPLTQANIAKAQAAGLNEVQLAAYRKMKTELEPQRIAAYIRDADKRADAAVTNAANGGIRAQAAVMNANTNQSRLSIDEQRAQTEAARVSVMSATQVDNSMFHQSMATAALTNAQTNIQNSDYRGAAQNLTVLRTQAGFIEKDIAGLNNLAKTMISQSIDPAEPTTDPQTGQPKPSVFDQTATLKAQRDQITSQIPSITGFIKNQGTSTVQQAMGNPSARVGPTPYAQPLQVNISLPGQTQGQQQGQQPGQQQQGQQTQGQQSSRTATSTTNKAGKYTGKYSVFNDESITTKALNKFAEMSYDEQIEALKADVPSEIRQRMLDVHAKTQKPAPKPTSAMPGMEGAAGRAPASGPAPSQGGGSFDLANPSGAADQGMKFSGWYPHLGEGSGINPEHKRLMVQDLQRGVPLTQLLMDMGRAGISHEQAIAMLKDLHANHKEIPGPWNALAKEK